METLGMPLREMKKRYKRSEIAIMGWRSAETSHKLKQTMKRGTKGDGEGLGKYGGSEVTQEILRQVPKIKDEQGEMDLSLATGDEALRILSAMGMNFMPMG